MKKLLATLLSAIICFSSLTGLTVFAEETEPATQPDTQPTTTEQITTTTTPKSTIPGGAYVTYNLTNVISSNMQEEVWGYYETTLSPEPGYKINYISVKQGDKDMPIIDNGDGTYTFKNEGGFTDNLTITAGAEILTTSEISQEYSTTTEPESSPITTTTTPKSTIPGGAYVTYNLTNVISSNMQEEVWGYYETTLTPKPGYAITNVSVTIDGKNVGKITKENGIYEIFVEYIRGDLTITAEAKRVLTETPQELQSLYPKTNFTVANLGKVGNYNLYYNVTQYYQFFNEIVKIGNYDFDCFAQQSPYGLGLYVVGNGKAYTLKDAYDKLNINMDTVYSLINKTNLHYNFTVKKVAQEKLSATNVILKSGTSKTVKVVGGTVKSWSTSNKNVATVNNGKVTAVGKGTATITATLITGEKLTCKVTVSGMHAHASVGYPTNITVNVGSKIGWDPYLGKWASCVSSNKNVATVNSKKVIKGISKGKAVISIKAKCGCTAKCTVTVKQPVTKIKLSLTKKTLKVKESCKIKAVATPGNANNSQIKWTTSNKKVACVTKEKTKSKEWNCIKAKKKGSAVIKAKAVDGSKTSAICKVTVK